MERVKFIDIQVALEDIQRRLGEIVGECLEVWDSMGGKLPGFHSFCEMYIKEKMQEWAEKARWN